MKVPYTFIGVILVISFFICLLGWSIWRSKFKKDPVKLIVQTNEEADTAETLNARGNLYAHQKKYE